MITFLHGVLLVVGVCFLNAVLKAASRGKYYAPSRISMKGQLYNLALWPERILKRKPAFQKITLPALKKAAIKGAKGLNDFGDTWYEEAYSKACEMMAKRKLSPLGQHILFDTMTRRLVARLRCKDEMKKLPAGVLEKPMLPPVFVLGLPRTGTTFLHRLLSLDTTGRCPKTYELYDVVPRYPNDPERDRKARIKYVKEGIGVLKSIVPHIDAIHEIGAEEPEECLVSMAMDLPLLFGTMPAYMENKQVLTELDFSHIYANHEKVLKLLAHQQSTEDKRWVLKCPMHLGFISTILKVFPKGTRIIWTHRDPRSSIPSLCSLFQTMIEMHDAGDIALDQVGRTTLDFWAYMLERADKDVSALGDSSNTVGHVKYNSLIADPVGTVRQLYNSFGWNFSPEYEQALEEYIAKNKEARNAASKARNSKHSYSLEQYALSEADIKKYTSFYSDKYL
jgi:hypothetical protein